MQVDAFLLESTMSHIRLHPELHNPDYFFEVTEFGMGACFAGRALLLGGYQPRLFNGVHGASVLTPMGDKRNAWYAARDLLGLDNQWAANLFTPLNTRRTLELKVKDLLNGAPLNLYGELLNQ